MFITKELYRLIEEIISYLVKNKEITWIVLLIFWIAIECYKLFLINYFLILNYLSLSNVINNAILVLFMLWIIAIAIFFIVILLDLIIMSIEYFYKFIKIFILYIWKILNKIIKIDIYITNKYILDKYEKITNKIKINNPFQIFKKLIVVFIIIIFILTIILYSYFWIFIITKDNNVTVTTNYNNTFTWKLIYNSWDNYIFEINWKIQVIPVDKINFIEYKKNK